VAKLLLHIPDTCCQLFASFCWEPAGTSEGGGKAGTSLGDHPTEAWGWDTLLSSPSLPCRATPVARPPLPLPCFCILQKLL